MRPIAEHIVVVHPRARRVRLRVTPGRGLVVTVPPRTPAALIENALAEHADWIERRLADVAEHRALVAGGPDALLPSEVAFAATGERWAVEYVHAADRGVRASAHAGVLTLAGDVDDGEACLDALRRWLATAARERLMPMLEEVSREQGLLYSRAGVRAQRTRWGSCSRDAGISLNRALMFLTPSLVRSILLHELVHTLHHDHSPRFWAELERRESGSRAARRAMRSAWKEVPAWAEPW